MFYLFKGILHGESAGGIWSLDYQTFPTWQVSLLLAPPSEEKILKSLLQHKNQVFTSTFPTQHLFYKLLPFQSQSILLIPYWAVTAYPAASWVHCDNKNPKKRWGYTGICRALVIQVEETEIAERRKNSVFQSRDKPACLEHVNTDGNGKCWTWRCRQEPHRVGSVGLSRVWSSF